MTWIAPSILSADFGRLHDEVTDVLRKGADWIHVDVMDGQFVPNITMGSCVVKAIRKAAGDAVVDVHLMIVEPDRYLEDFRQAGADILTVHAEACVHLHRSIGHIRQLGAKAGVALNPHTPPEILDYVLDDIDVVLVMSVNPGFGNQTLIPSALEKIRVLREKIRARGLQTKIEVDGGVKPDNAHLFVQAGADVLVSGSGVYQATDREAAIKQMKSLVV